jgi:hypothetical protein
MGDFYKSYQLYCKAKGLRSLDKKAYREVMTQMGAVMSDILLQDGIISLPRLIGEVYFKKSETEQVLKKGSLVLFNEHTEGFTYRLFWQSPERNGKKSKLWCFSGFRDTKRESAQLFKQKRVQYPDFQLMTLRTPNS